jgi:uncharacterized pyridoxamine 5'-phosphate oxidase family protein
MKAKIKIDYSEIKKNEIVIVSELHKNFVSVLCNGRKIDFGYSEIEFLTDKKNLFYIGRTLSQLQTIGFVMREKDIKKAIFGILPKLKISFKEKCYNEFIYN